MDYVTPYKSFSDLILTLEKNKNIRVEYNRS